MTCIAWDGKMLAADRRATIGCLYRTATKIHRVGSMLVGYSGAGAQVSEMLAWARGGFRKSAFPEVQRDPDINITLLVIRPKGLIQVYEHTPYPIEYGDKQFAIGSGRDFALVAMYLGKSASDAVLIAAEFDPGCGGGVDTLTL